MRLYQLVDTSFLLAHTTTTPAPCRQAVQRFKIWLSGSVGHCEGEVTTTTRRSQAKTRMHSLLLLPLLLLATVFPATVVQSFSPSPLRLCRSLTPGSASASAAPRLSMAAAAAAAEFNWKSLKKATEEKMSKSVEAIQTQFNTIRAGGANPSILDRVVVDYFGSPTPLNQVARVGASGAQTLVIEPFDKSLVKEVERAIAQADLGLAAQNDGSGVLRINLPALTEERRKDLVKQAKSLCEEGKVAVRNVRRDFVDKVKVAEKDKAISKDDSKAFQDELQKVTDDFTKKLDNMLKTKEKDLLKI